MIHDLVKPHHSRFETAVLCGCTYYLNVYPSWTTLFIVLIIYGATAILNEGIYKSKIGGGHE